ncbi:hypothetical protein KSP39_PZI022730 [Platanthera zijinensis]|uniref:Nucleolar complex protein 2 homolog n=1 Tax=Platanthera zijinensis TaxID=2320716 RepID=A0AAP0AUP5_9ASPA
MHYLLPREFVLYSEHQALRYLDSQRKLGHRHAKWVEYLQDFHYVLKHRAGVENKPAGALSCRVSLLQTMTARVDGLEREHVDKRRREQVFNEGEKDPEFYQYLKEHDKELLEFNDKDTQDDERSDLEDGVDAKPTTEKFQTPSTRVITTTKIDSWCSAIKQQRSLGAVRSMLRAFRTACHHGDDTKDDSEQKFTVVSSSVFNKIMVFVLNEMDGILRKLLEAPSTGGKKETILDLMTTKAWKAHGSLMRLYLGNTLHILNEMTDEQMISFTLKRLIASTVFLAAFPVLLRKYIRVVLHTWGTGTGALPVVSFLFMRDLCVRLGSDCLDSCLKGMYKAYIMNCKLPKHISSSKLQHINFLGNCVSELYGLDPLSAYQHAFVSIRQLAVILRGTINERGSQVHFNADPLLTHEFKKKKSYQKVYDWQFIFCLELWTKVISTYSSEADFGPLAYPLTQIIYGVATLVPTARYFPLRLRCIRMMNCIAGATERFIPVSSLLLDMLEMKVLSSCPTGGVGKAVDMQCVKKLDKQTLKTRSFQEVCIYSIVEELAEHFAQWSYSIAFFELSFITLVRLRSFCKSTKVDRFRREVKELIHQLEANCSFTNSKRIGIGFSPSDPAAAIFLKACHYLASSFLDRLFSTNCEFGQQKVNSVVRQSCGVAFESDSRAGSRIALQNQDRFTKFGSSCGVAWEMITDRDGTAWPRPALFGGALTATNISYVEFHLVRQSSVSFLSVSGRFKIMNYCPKCWNRQGPIPPKARI